MEIKIIKELIKLSDKAYKKSESPISAIIVKNNKIISKAYNKRNKSNSTISHAEVIAILKANKKLKSWRLNNCTLYVTVEPCEMCSTIIKEARIKRVEFLIKRSPEKKQYNKTVFSQMNIINDKNMHEEYRKKLNNFWENKRKK